MGTAAIAAAIRPVLLAFSLCRNARPVVRRRRPAGPLREERLPRGDAVLPPDRWVIDAPPVSG